ncbi:glucosyltransferase domain-containing protein [Microgenomates group bacterium]|nr:glucosyltransferase domain-containing protein [Microgenomates group bacterium]
MKQKWVKWALLGLILVLAMFWRFWRIDISPAGLSPDEIDYVMSAKSVFYEGKDLALEQSIWRIKPFTVATPMAEWAPLYQVPTAFLGSSLLNSKIMPAMYGVLLVGATYFLVRLLTIKAKQSEAIALLSAGVVAVNPWAISIYRSGFDAPPALLFSIISFIFMILLIRKGKWYYLLGQLVFFSLGFFTYHGLKIPLVALTILFFIYLLLQEKTKKRNVGAGIGMVAVIIIFITNVLALSLSGTRTSEISLLNLGVYREQAQEMRENSLIQSKWLTKAAINMPTVYGYRLLVNFFQALNLKSLFLTGYDSGVILRDFGQFYVFEVVLVFMGLGAVWGLKNKQHGIFITGAILAATTGYIIKTEASNVSLQMPFLIVIGAGLIAGGMVGLMSWIKKKWLKIVVGAVIGLFYVGGMILFANNYFTRSMVDESEYYFLSSRLLAKYLALEEKRPVLIFSRDGTRPYQNYRFFLFYNDIYNRKTAKELATPLRYYDGQHYQTRRWENLTFSDDCSLFDEIRSDTVIIMTAQIADACGKQMEEHGERLKNPIAIADMRDSGAIYYIFNDSVCGRGDMSNIMKKKEMKDFRIEELGVERFCSEWLLQAHLEIRE